MVVPSPSSSPLCLLLLFLSTFLDLSASSITQQYLKLPLLHRPTDTRRLSHPRRTSLKSPLVSGAPSGSGQYFVSLRLGTPPQTLLLVADTGSDLTWVKCSACTSSCSVHLPGSAFLARHSSTFSPTHCFSSLCKLVPHPDPNPCNLTRLHSPCRYDYSYSDGSSTSGFFSTEITTLNTSSGGEKKIENVAFGCGFQISGPSVTGQSFNGAHGVMGLGRGPISFSTQLGRRFGNKFSYCLKDYTLSPPPTSYLMIGNDPSASWKERDLSFTPLLSNPLSPTFYYVGIRDAYVGGEKLRINPNVWEIDDLGNGGTVIDSGTTLSFFAEPAYRAILTAFKRSVKLPEPDENIQGFELCVNVSGVSRRPKLPRLSLGFAGGSVYSPPPRNYFIDVSEGVKCLAVQPVDSGDGFSVIGNLMQQGFLLEFDRDKSRLGFSRRGCASP